MPLPKEAIKKAVFTAVHAALREWVSEPLPEGFRRFIHVERNTIELGEGSDSIKVTIL